MKILLLLLICSFLGVDFCLANEEIGYLNLTASSQNNGILFEWTTNVPENIYSIMVIKCVKTVNGNLIETINELLDKFENKSNFYFINIDKTESGCVFVCHTFIEFTLFESKLYSQEVEVKIGR